MGIYDKNTNNTTKNVTKGDILTGVAKYQLFYLRNKISNFFNSLDDSLFNLAEKSHSNKEQSNYFDALKLVRQKRSEIKRDFFQGIKIQYKKFQQNIDDKECSANKSEENPLALIENNELDKKLVMDDLIKKSESKYIEQLYYLNKRLSFLVGKQDHEENTQKSNPSNHNPLSPKILVKVFTDSINAIEFNNKITVIIYKLFERNVMSQLEDLYAKVNQLLVTHDILPHIKFSIKKKSSASIDDNDDNSELSHKSIDLQQNSHDNKQTQAHNSFGHANKEANQQNNQQNLDDNFTTILSMLQANHQYMQQGQTDNQQQLLPYISLGIMIDALSILQNTIFQNIQINEPIPQSPIEIKDDLIKQLHQVDNSFDKNRVKRKDSDIIDLVGMLFQFIVDDRNLPKEIQVILVKLQIPYLKIALRDRNIFADKTHVARVLLDRLALASVGWSEESDWNNKFRNKLEEIALYILQCENYSAEFFQQLQDDFDAFLLRRKKKSEVVQRRTKETTTGEEKIIRARKDSAQLLVNKMSKKVMPIFVRDILLGEWSSVLVLMFLRHSTDEEIFSEKITFVDNLINYSRSDSTKRITIHQIQELMQIYRKGLGLVAFNPAEINTKCVQLSQCLTEIHALTAVEPSHAKDLQLLQADNIFNLEELRNRKNEIAGYIKDVIEPLPENTVDNQAIEDRYFKMVDSITEENWLEFSRLPQASLRAKLAWVSSITDDYVFVNSRGMKVLSSSKADLAYRFKTRKVRILDQKALVDRALSSIALRLKVANFRKKP